MRAASLAVLLLVLCLPSISAAQDVVDVEMLIASPNGRYYVILQQDGEAEIVRRSAKLPPIRSRRGEKRPEMSVLRLGATAEELSRASGLLHGIEPEPGDAIIGTAQLRDPLDDLHVFDDGTGFVARYASSPSRFEDLEPIRGPDGSDEGLVMVEQRPVGEDRIVASFVHLYARKDVLFWGDPGRKLVMMVAGGSELSVEAERGAYLADRASGTRPRMIAWSLDAKKTVSAPLEALLDRIRTADPSAGLVAFLLARELDFDRTVIALGELVGDPRVPHPTRLHAATTLHAEGGSAGDLLIVETARGRMGPIAGEAPLVLGDEAEGTTNPGAPSAAERVRAYAVGVLPITHPGRAPRLLLSLAADDVVGDAARKALAEGPWPTPDWTQQALIDSVRDLSRTAAERAAAAELLASTVAARLGKKPEDDPLWELLGWLASDRNPQIHGPVLAAFPDLADVEVVPRLIAAITGPASTGGQRRDAAWSLAARAWRSEEARETLLRLAETSGANTGARESLGTLWQVEGGAVLDVLVQRSAGDGSEARAALHSLLIAARGSDDPAAFVEGLERIPPQSGRRGLSVRRMLAVMDPARVRWE